MRNYGYGREGIAPPEFGQNANTIRTQTIPLDVALNNQRFEIAGSALWAQDASDSDAEITVSFEDSGDNGIKVSRGFFMRGLEFSRIFVTATVQAGKYITLVHFVESDDNVQVENPAVAMNDVTVIGPLESGRVAVAESPVNGYDFASDVIAVAGVPELLVNVSAQHRYNKVLIRALTTNTGEAYIGESAAMAVGTRFTLSPGDSLEISVNGNIYGDVATSGDGFEYVVERYI